jgi:hypothetical protein
LAQRKETLLTTDGHGFLTAENKAGPSIFTEGNEGNKDWKQPVARLGMKAKETLNAQLSTFNYLRGLTSD